MDTNSNLYKAGRVLRFTAWIALLASAYIIVSITYLNKEMYGMVGMDMYIVMLSIAIPSALFSLYVGNALKQNKKWAKIPSVALATLAVLSPPLGTILGIFTLYYIYRGWSEA